MDISRENRNPMLWHRASTTTSRAPVHLPCRGIDDANDGEKNVPVPIECSSGGAVPILYHMSGLPSLKDVSFHLLQWNTLNFPHLTSFRESGRDFPSCFAAQ
jgi:hypothetical protein